MDLLPHSDNLISAVLNANQNAVVVIQSGTPVRMPWIHKAGAVLQAWYGGNEAGHGIADVVYGDVNPCAKLPLSFQEICEILRLISTCARKAGASYTARTYT